MEMYRKCQCWIYYTKLRVNQYAVNVTCPWHFLKHWKYHVSWTFPLPSNWHVVRFPYYSENLTFTWDFLGQWHMACHYISYAIQKFDIYIWFLWSTYLYVVHLTIDWKSGSLINLLIFQVILLFLCYGLFFHTCLHYIWYMNICNH